MSPLDAVWWRSAPDRHGDWAVVCTGGGVAWDMLDRETAQSLADVLNERKLSTWEEVHREAELRRAMKENPRRTVEGMRQRLARLERELESLPEEIAWVEAWLASSETTDNAGNSNEMPAPQPRG